MSLPLKIRQFGVQPYRQVWEAMGRFTDRRTAADSDEIWLLQHPPVFTLGQAGKLEHVLAPGAIELVQVDRGGQVTYHGPGQLVAYPLIDLRRAGLGVRELVTRIEQVLIDTLAEWQITAERLEGAPGVYVDGAKIGALGLRVRRGCSFHGLALNVAMDLSPFARINPCGYQGMAVTQMLDLATDVDMDSVAAVFLDKFCRQFGYGPRAHVAGLPELSDTIVV